MRVAILATASYQYAVARVPEILVMSTVIVVPESGTYAMAVSPDAAREAATVAEPEPNPAVTTVCA